MKEQMKGSRLELPPNFKLKRTTATTELELPLKGQVCEVRVVGAVSPVLTAQTSLLPQG